MLNIPDQFAAIMESVSAAYGGPYYDSVLHYSGKAVYDDGGSIITPGTPEQYTCQAQVDAITKDMRQSEGYVEGDMRILVLASTLAADITTDNEIEVLAGPHARRWMIKSISRDPMGVYFELRGRPV